VRRSSLFLSLGCAPRLSLLQQLTLGPPHPDIPMNEYYEYFGPTYRLDVPQSNTEDMNTPEYLDKIKAQVFENLRQTAGGAAPSVQTQRESDDALALAALLVSEKAC